MSCVCRRLCLALICLLVRPNRPRTLALSAQLAQRVTTRAQDAHTSSSPHSLPNKLTTLLVEATNPTLVCAHETVDLALPALLCACALSKHDQRDAREQESRVEIDHVKMLTMCQKMPGRDDSVYLAKLAEQAERYEGLLREISVPFARLTHFRNG